MRRKSSHITAQKRITRQRLRLILSLALGLILITGLTGGAYWVYQSRLVPNQMEKVTEKFIETTSDQGFKIKKILVKGRDRTPAEEILKTLNVYIDDPILSIDLSTKKQTLEQLPWIRTATIERHMPDTLIVHLTERHPSALWQQEGTHQLIDEQGDIIPITNIHEFNDLVIITGDKVRPHLSDILNLIAAEPVLKTRVIGASWVGDRRWDVFLNNKIKIMLPEKDVGLAWAKLAQLQTEQKILERNIKMIDLRLSDRLIIRKAAEPKKPTGQNT